jgi:hypothetical protein
MFFRNKENEELKAQLEHKTSLLNQNKSDLDCKFERLQSIEFHYDELLNKHKLCLDCMTKQRKDNEILKERNDFLNVSNFFNEILFLR